MSERKETTQTSCGLSHLPRQSLSEVQESRSNVTLLPAPCSEANRAQQCTQNTWVPRPHGFQSIWLGVQEPRAVPATDLPNETICARSGLCLSFHAHLGVPPCLSGSKLQSVLGA